MWRTDRLLGDGARMDASGCCRWTAPRPLAAARGRQAFARFGEQLAAAHLAQDHALELLGTNLRVAREDLRGELDVVAHDPRSGLLVVCEVKSRSQRDAGGALETLGARQQARIRRMTGVLLADGRLRAREVRFDLVTLDLATLDRATLDRATLDVGREALLVHHAGAW